MTLGASTGFLSAALQAECALWASTSTTPAPPGLQLGYTTLLVVVIGAFSLGACIGACGVVGTYLAGKQWLARKSVSTADLRERLQDYRRDR